MGLTPQQVDQMSLWQWLAAFEGWVEAKTPSSGAKLSAAEVEDIFAWIDVGPANDQVVKSTVYDFDGARLIRVRDISFKA